jgi:hypothetical protein
VSDHGSGDGDGIGIVQLCYDRCNYVESVCREIYREREEVVKGKEGESRIYPSSDRAGVSYSSLVLIDVATAIKV